MQCGRCPKVLEVGASRWYCSGCQMDHCHACAEVSGQVQTVQDFFTASTNPIACAVAQVSTVDDFLVASQPVNSSSPPNWPRNRRGSHSEGPGGRYSVSSMTSDGDTPTVGRRHSSTRAERRASRRDDQRAFGQLSAVPFLGIRPLFQIQKDTLDRIERLIRHGDAPGARHALARARLLNMEEEDLEASIAALRRLQAEETLLGTPDGFPGG